MLETGTEFALESHVVIKEYAFTAVLDSYATVRGLTVKGWDLKSRMGTSGWM